MEFNLLAESMKDGFSPIRKSTSRGGQWNGPCILPSCNGTGRDRLRIQPHKGDYGWFICSVCGTSGTGIDWLIIKRGYSMNEALRMVGWKPKDGSTPHFSIPRHVLTGDIHPTHQAPCEEWQSSAKAFVDYSVNLLWSEQGQPVLDYLRARGLKDETIKSAQLGYNPTEMLRPGGKWGREKYVKLWQGIVIPWFVGDELWRLTIRDETVADGDNRYKQVAGGSNGLYMAFSLHFDRPVVLVEGEIDALSVAQECGHHVSVVATGTTEGAHTAKWLAALACKDLVLVAFDADAAGDTAAKWWLDRLESAHRIRPWWDDANQMLQDGVDLLNDWILPCIQSIKASQIVIPDECEVCCVCLDLGKDTPAALEYEEFMYCAEHYPHTAKLETFVDNVQQKIPAFNGAKVEYWRKEDWPRMKERITHELIATMPRPKKPKMWDLINELEKEGLLPEPQPVIYPDYWASIQKQP
jgi:DNA primase